MPPKSAHLAPAFASQFRDPSVVGAHHFRSPYPPQVIEHLLAPRVAQGRVLNAGAGTGEIARTLVRRGVPVDALDPSDAMMARGRQLPGGVHPLLAWICGTAEEAPLSPPDGLIVTAASLHWMDWQVEDDGCIEALHVQWRKISGVSWLAGIGCITSLFIAGLASARRCTSIRRRWASWLGPSSLAAAGLSCRKRPGMRPHPDHSRSWLAL
jgi:SAM-dependent methyltransferase